MKIGDWFDTMTAVRVGSEEAQRRSRAASSPASPGLAEALERTRDCLNKSLEREAQLRSRVLELEAELAAVKKELSARHSMDSAAGKP